MRAVIDTRIQPQPFFRPATSPAASKEEAPSVPRDRAELGRQRPSAPAPMPARAPQVQPPTQEPVQETFLDVLEGVDPTSLSPLGDILELGPEGIREGLIARQPALRVSGLRLRRFRDELQSLVYDEAGKPRDISAGQLRELETRWTENSRLSPGQVTLLLEGYRDLGSFEGLTECYTRARAQDPDLSKFEIPREIYLDALQHLNRPAEVIAEGEQLLAQRVDLVGLPAAPAARLLEDKLPLRLQVSSQVLENLGQAYRAVHSEAEQAIDKLVSAAGLTELVASFASWTPDTPGTEALDRMAGGVVRGAETVDGYLGLVTGLTGRELKGPVREALVQKLNGLKLEAASGGLDPNLVRAVENGSGRTIGRDLAKASRVSLEMARSYHEAAFEIDFGPGPGLDLLRDELALGNRQAAERLAPLVAYRLKESPELKSAAAELALNLTPEAPTVAEDSTRGQITRRLFEVGRTIDLSAGSRFVAGSWRFVSRGGTVDMPVNRPTVHAYRHLLKDLGLKKLNRPQDVQQVCERLHGFIDDQFQLVDPQTGRRPMENLQSSVHHRRDDIAALRHDVCQSRALGSSHTNPHVELLFGQGDCRGTSINFGVPFSIWKGDRQLEHLRSALTAAQAGDEQTAGQQLDQARQWDRLEVLMVDLTFQGNLRLEKDAAGNPVKYRLLTDSEGRPLGAGQLLRGKDGKPQPIEDHSLPFLAKLGEDGLVDELIAVDPFYRDLYPLGWKPVDPEGLLDKDKGLYLGTMGVAASDGTLIHIWGQPTAYSGSAPKPTRGEWGVESFGGMPVSIGDPTRLVGEHTAMDDLADAMLGLVSGQTKRDMLGAVSSERLEEATAGTHHRWYQARLNDFRSPTQSFLGWGPQRVVVDEKVGSFTDDELRGWLQSSGLPGGVSPSKLAAVRQAPEGTVVLDPRFLPYHQLKGQGSPLSAGVLALTRYLEDVRYGEELGAVLSSLLRGWDPAGQDCLEKIQHLAALASRLDPPETDAPATGSWHSLHELNPRGGVDAQSWRGLADRVGARLETADGSLDQVVQAIVAEPGPDPVGELTLAVYLADFGGNLPGIREGTDFGALHQLSILKHGALQAARLAPQSNQPAGTYTSLSEPAREEARDEARAGLEWLKAQL